MDSFNTPTKKAGQIPWLPTGKGAGEEKDPLAVESLRNPCTIPSIGWHSEYRFGLIRDDGWSMNIRAILCEGLADGCRVRRG